MQSFKEFMQPPDLQPHPAYHRYPAVSTFGLITGHNPMGVRLGDRQNYDSNGKVLEDIKALGCDATVVQGMYAGHREETFCVANITERDLLRLAARHRQEAVVWGYRRHGQEGETYFKVYYLDNGQTAAEQRMDVGPEDVETKEAFFLAVKEGRVSIPTFTPRKNAVALTRQPDLGDYSFNLS